MLIININIVIMQSRKYAQFMFEFEFRLFSVTDINPSSTTY